jgi:ABC-type polysaccharide/polyol phosphate export permease
MASVPAAPPLRPARPSWNGDYFFLFENLVLKDFRIRYRNMSLGLLWSLLNPLVMMLVLTFVFSKVMGQRSFSNFPVAILCGLVPYNFFVAALLSGANSIIENASLIKKMPVPRATIPVAAVFSNVVHLFIQIALLLALAIATGQQPNRYWLWLPVLWALEIVFVCGLALAAGAVNVFVRDTRYLVESFNLILFWLVPIFYPFEIIPPQYREVYQLNPVAALVMGMRNVLLEGAAPAASLLSKLALVAAVSFAAGYLLFQRLKRGFADHI